MLVNISVASTPTHTILTHILIDLLPIGTHLSFLFHMLSISYIL